MINYKMFKSHKQNKTINSTNCQSCDQTKSTNRVNQMNNNMNEIINSQKNISHIPNTNNLPKNIHFNNKITIEYFNNNTKSCGNC
jgi:ribosomal protein L32